jgi:hypothetical protein
VSLLTCSPIIVAEQPEPLAIARKAIESLDATTLDDDWHFTLKIVEEDEEQIVRSNPSGGKYEKRELISVNGVVPGQQRQEKFRESEVKRVDELDPESSGYRYLVDATTLSLVQASGNQLEFSFRPKIKAMEDVRDQLQGSVWLNLETGQIEIIEIFNLEKLSPAFSVTVDSYKMTLRFQLEQGENLLKELESRVIGNVGFLKNFERVTHVSFSDYQRAMPQYN